MSRRPAELIAHGRKTSGDRPLRWSRVADALAPGGWFLIKFFVEFSRGLECILDSLSLHVPRLKLSTWERALQGVGAGSRLWQNSLGTECSWRQSPSPGCLTQSVPASVAGACGQGHAVVRGPVIHKVAFPGMKPSSVSLGLFFLWCQLGLTDTHYNSLEGISFHSSPDFYCCPNGLPGQLKAVQWTVLLVS